MMRVGTSPRTEPTADRIQYLIIVARDQTDLWSHLVQDFAEYKGVEVYIDRRQGERRQSIRVYSPDSRGADRRRWPGIERELLQHPYAIVPVYLDSPTLPPVIGISRVSGTVQ